MVPFIVKLLLMSRPETSSLFSTVKLSHVKSAKYTFPLHEMSPATNKLLLMSRPETSSLFSTVKLSYVKSAKCNSPLHEMSPATNKLLLKSTSPLTPSVPLTKRFPETSILLIVNNSISILLTSNVPPTVKFPQISISL